MVKRPKPSMSDALAQIAAQSPDPVATLKREDVTTLQRGNVEHGNAQRGNAPRVDVEHDDVRERAGYKRRVRYEKPHASIYAHPKVFKALREIAAAKDCKPHDLYLEGLRLVLQANGRDFDVLNRGE